MNNEHLIFQNALDDIENLLDLISTEQRDDMLLVWNYHLFLNHQIIASILNKQYNRTALLVTEMKRSIEATTKYCMVTDQF